MSILTAILGALVKALVGFRELIAGWIIGRQRTKIKDMKNTEKAKDRAHEADDFDNVTDADKFLRERQSKRRK